MYLKKSTLPDWQGGWMENETIGLASFNALAQEGWHIQVIGVDNLGAEDSLLLCSGPLAGLCIAGWWGGSGGADRAVLADGGSLRRRRALAGRRVFAAGWALCLTWVG